MRRTKILSASLILAATVIGLLVLGCVPKPPRSFITINESTGAQWKSIEVRPELTYEQGWQLLVDTISTKWDIETMEKEAGYIRTAWLFATGKDPGCGRPYKYGKRITLKFSEDRKILRMKTEAFYEVTGFPTDYGMDSVFDDDAFSQIQGKLGRIKH